MKAPRFVAALSPCLHGQAQFIPQTHPACSCSGPALALALAALALAPLAYERPAQPGRAPLAHAAAAAAAAPSPAPGKARLRQRVGFRVCVRRSWQPGREAVPGAFRGHSPARPGPPGGAQGSSAAAAAAEGGGLCARALLALPLSHLWG